MQIQRSPKYRNQTLEMDKDGNVVMEQDDTVSEILERIYSRFKTFVFDENYGSEFYKIINNKNLSNSTVKNWVRKALTPMVQNRTINSEPSIIVFIQDSLVVIDITAVNAEGKNISAVFRSFLTS